MSSGILDVLKKPDRFVWAAGVTPLSGYGESAVITACYIVAIYGLQFFMKRRAAFDLTRVAALHNFALSAFSLVVFAGCIYSLFKFLAGGGALSSLFCESFDSSNQPPPGSNTLFFWCYLFYLSKYYDFFDTLLLVLRKKDLGFLHMYHHASLPLLCVLTMSNWRLPVWTGAIINSGVHVVMYYYFGLRMAFPDRKIWWRKYVTVIQILQFTLGFVFIAYFLTIFVVGVTIAENGSAFSITVERGCSVNPLVVGLNSFVNLSFFVLFVQIYIRDNFSNTKPKVSGKNSTPALCVPTQQDGGKKHV